MIYVRKQFGNMVVVLHTNDISTGELFGLCVASNKLKETEINMYNYSRIFDENNDKYKILVDLLLIKLNIIDHRPYYTILYHPINSENTYEGYGSYSLSIVEEWLKKYFILERQVL